MAISTKAEIYNQLFVELADETECVGQIDQILKYMCDWFDTSTLEEFLEFVKAEKET